MSFAAEPYAVFVEDVLANLTGGVSRIRFRFVDEELPFRLGAHERVLPESLRVHRARRRRLHAVRRASRDFRYTEDAAIEWLSSSRPSPPPARSGPTPAPTCGSASTACRAARRRSSTTATRAASPARWPSRSPASTRCMSHQLDAVYQAAFVDTAGGRDLDQVAALVGVERRGATHARGEVLFRRTTPATADIAILAGTLVSTTPTAAVAVTVETTETVTLRRGTVSVAAPVQARQSGPAGVAAANTLTVDPPPDLRHRGRAQPGADVLRRRRRERRGAAGEGQAGVRDVGALDRRRAEGRAGRRSRGSASRTCSSRRTTSPPPASCTSRWRPRSTPTTAVLASRTLEEHRPAGVRIVHNLPAPTALVPTLAEDTGGGGDGPVPGIELTGVFMDLAATLTVTPADAQLTTSQRDRLAADAGAALLAAVDLTGVGEPVVYNRLVAAVMAVEGVLDAVVEIGPKGGELKRFNLRAPTAGARARLDAADLTVVLRGRPGRHRHDHRGRAPRAGRERRGRGGAARPSRTTSRPASSPPCSSRRRRSAPAG